MGNLFQNLAPEHLIEIFIIIFISAILGWLLSMFFWKKRLDNNSQEWENRLEVKSKEFADLRHNYVQLDGSLKESLDKYATLESQLVENSSMSQKLADEKSQLVNQLESVSSSNQSYQKQLSELERVKKKHQETLPILESQQEELSQLKQEIEELTQQKGELNEVIDSLKDFRTQSEDLQLQLQKRQEEVEKLEHQVLDLNEAIIFEREEGPRVLELSGMLRWAESENQQLKDKAARLDHLINQVAWQHLSQEGENLALAQQLEQLAAEKPQEAPANGELQAYQIQIWEREGALRWAEQEKEELAQKISELEYAQSVLQAEQENLEVPEEKEVAPLPELSRAVGVDADGELTQLAMDLEEVNEKNSHLNTQIEEKEQLLEERAAQIHSLEEQVKEIQEKRGTLRSELREKADTYLALEKEIQSLQEEHQRLEEQFTELQDKSLAWKGRLRWELLEKGDLLGEKEEVGKILEEATQRLKEQELSAQELAVLLKQKEEEFQKISHKMASEELAQALIQSEELEDLTQEVEQLRDSTYLAAEAEWNHLAMEAQLAVKAKNWEEKVQDLEQKRQLIREEKEWELAELRSQLAELQQRETEQEAELESLKAELSGLRESTHTAAQLHVDDEAENLRISLKIKEMEGNLLQLKAVETERESLENTLEELRASLQWAAQNQADEEAGSIRQELKVAQLKDQLAQLSEQSESEVSDLLQEVQSLKTSVEQRESEREEQQKELEQLSLQLNESREKLENISRQAANDQDLINEFAANQSTLESERSFLEHRVSELQSSIQDAAQQSVDHLGDLARLTLALNAANEKIEQLEQGTASQTHQIQDFSVKLEAQEQMLNKRIQELEGELSSKQQEYQQAGEDYEQRLTDLTKQLEETKTEFSQKESQQAQREQELEAALEKMSKDSAEKQDTQMQHIGEVAETLQKAQEDWEKQEQSYHQQIDYLEKQLQSAKTEAEDRMHEKAQELKQLEEGFQQVKKDAENKDGLISQLEARVAELTQRAGNGSLVAQKASVESPATVSFAMELGEEEKDQIRERVFERRDYLELNFGRIGIASALDQDPLTEIEGIDAFTEERLNLIQIYCFRQIANFTAEEEKLITETLELVPGIIQQKAWKKQALEKLRS